MKSVIIIGLTNRIDCIDPAFLRPGRFDVQIKIKAPNQDGIKQIYTIKMKCLVDNKFLAENFNIDFIAQKSSNFTFASSTYSAAHIWVVKIRIYGPTIC